MVWTTEGEGPKLPGPEKRRRWSTGWSCSELVSVLSKVSDVGYRFLKYSKGGGEEGTRPERNSGSGPRCVRGPNYYRNGDDEKGSESLRGWGTRQ